MKQVFTFGDTLRFNAPKDFKAEIASELWNGFCFTACTAEFDTAQDGFCLFTDGTIAPVIGETDCAVEISEKGIAINATSGSALMDGYCKLLSLIKPLELEKGNELFSLPVGRYEIKKSPLRKMIHFCVFPETTLFFLKRLFRLASYLRYTHIVLEFWGTYRFECMPELAWADKSYTKAELAPIINEAIGMGLEIIPDFNHLGHASSGRIIYGKHAVLDQHPRLEMLFSDDGWAWNIDNPRVAPLLKQIRAELCELCGKGEYFHIGCDECYTYAENVRQMERTADYLQTLCLEVLNEGRRPILWGDMFLCRDTVQRPEDESYYCNCISEDVADMLFKKLPKQAIIADWQYDVYKNVWRSTEYFAKRGYDTICCPWKNIDCALATVSEFNAYGFMETTWHHLHQMIYLIAYVNEKQEHPDQTFSADIMRAKTATLLRKLCPAKSYAEAGWSESQMEAYER